MCPLIWFKICHISKCIHGMGDLLSSLIIKYRSTCVLIIYLTSENSSKVFVAFIDKYMYLHVTAVFGMTFVKKNNLKNKIKTKL